ncbi:alpha/beta hydrolase [Rubritalea tangerina]|uniref:Alpha/beta hydrolase n=2 Tax=Rubritalea tangerina TaxID=430798 RepID=A0ABW4Z7K1_9BACT
MQSVLPDAKSTLSGWQTILPTPPRQMDGAVVWVGMRSYLLMCMAVLGMVFPSCATEKNLTAAIALGLMGEDGGDRLFYYPTKDAPFTPKKYGYAYEDVTFPSNGGVQLHGWWIPAKEAKATVVYAHGNAGSVAHHFVFVYWLIDAGYNVLLYDYRGYGKSGGKVAKDGIVMDAAAALKYASAREGAGDIIAFGHSLGGAKTLAALKEVAPERLKAVVVDSTFSSYQDMAERVAGAKARKVVSASHDPVDCVRGLPAGVPILIVHGTADETIPFEQAQKLHAAAKKPKELMAVEGGNHVNCFFIKEGRYREKLLGWMSDVLRD